MYNSLYSKKVTCPICGKKFTTMKAKINSCKVKKKDEDFCTHYVDLNPAYYEIFVCPSCAYSATENSFENVSEEEIKLLREAFSGRVVERNFCDQRSLEDAIDACKLAIYTAELTKASFSVLAGLCLKLSWLYRFAGDDQEKVFLDYSLKNYLEAFEKEELPFGNLNKMSVMYLIGELFRRLGKYSDSIVWFGKAVASPEKGENQWVEKLAREQWKLARDQNKEMKQMQ